MWKGKLCFLSALNRKRWVNCSFFAPKWVLGRKYLDVCPNFLLFGWRKYEGAWQQVGQKKFYLRMKVLVSWDGSADECWRFFPPKTKNFQGFEQPCCWQARLESVAKSPQCPRLFYAVNKSRMSTVQLLLTEGANPEATWKRWYCICWCVALLGLL